MAFRDLSTRKGAPCDVVAIFDSEVSNLVAELVQVGTLVGLSTTRDGGALGITVTLDGDYVREYFRETEAARDWLSLVLAEVRDEVAARPASADRDNGQRRRRGR